MVNKENKNGNILKTQEETAGQPSEEPKTDEKQNGDPVEQIADKPAEKAAEKEVPRPAFSERVKERVEGWTEAHEKSRPQRTGTRDRSKTAIHRELEERMKRLQHTQTELSDKLKNLLKKEISEQKKRKSTAPQKLSASFPRITFTPMGSHRKRCAARWRTWDQPMLKSVRSCPAVWICCRKATAGNWKSCGRM